MKKVVLLVVALMGQVVAATPQVKNMKAMQQYPWGDKVYISYEVEGDVASSAGSGKAPFLLVTAKDKTSGRVYEATHLTGDTGTSTGLHKVIWDVEKQGVTINSANRVFTVAYCDELYLVVDLSSGANSASYPISHLYSVPSGGWTDTYKTTKLVLRRIMPGSFKMGGQYNVVLTKSFYMGIFEVTQKQYELVMGNNPSSYKGDTRPVENVSWNMIRGDSDTYNWPSAVNVDPNSFMGRLRARTGLNFDLPTEAQWEYACRAGTTSAYGGDTENDLKQLGRYYGNRSDGKGGYSDAHTTVGSYLPNAWWLYDMHGNVWEWCLDWYGNLSSGGTDPSGSSSGARRVVRGGGWSHGAGCCASSYRDSGNPSSMSSNYIGFRLVRTLSD